MKKIYVKPEMVSTVLEMQQMVCLSVNGTTDNENDLLTRDFDDWDE